MFYNIPVLGKIARLDDCFVLDTTLSVARLNGVVGHNSLNPSEVSLDASVVACTARRGQSKTGHSDHTPDAIVVLTRQRSAAVSLAKENQRKNILKLHQIHGLQQEAHQMTGPSERSRQTA